MQISACEAMDNLKSQGLEEKGVEVVVVLALPLRK